MCLGDLERRESGLTHQLPVFVGHLLGDSGIVEAERGVVLEIEGDRESEAESLCETRKSHQFASLGRTHSNRTTLILIERDRQLQALPDESSFFEAI